MNIEVVCSTVNQKNINFYRKLNIKTDALIVNQCGYNKYEEIVENGKKIRMINTDTKGSGTSRNIGLLNSKADIIVLCDDDEVFEDDYKEKIENSFKKNPDVDFFIFKTEIYNSGKKTIKVKEEKNLKVFNALRYGSVHFVFKREEIEKRNIHFSTYFGAGSKNGSGEDTLFLKDAIDKKLKVRTNTNLIAKVYNDSSTWFKEYDEKFFYDKGKLSVALFNKGYRLYIEQFLFRHKEMLEKVSKKEAKKYMLKGAKDYIERKKYE